MAGDLLKLFWVCAKIGLVAFGGGNTAIPLLQAEAVPRWLTQGEFGELVGINFAFPGVSVIKLAGMIGLRAAGVAGLVVAIIGMAAPGLILTVTAYGVVQRYKDYPRVSNALLATQYAAFALLLSSALTILGSATKPRIHPLGMVTAGVMFLAVQFMKVPPALAILAAIAAGATLF